MKFKFKISHKIKEAWELYKQNIGLFVLILTVLLILQMIATKRVLIFYIISVLLSVFVGYMITLFLLKIVDKKEFDPFSKKSLPSIKMLWNFIKTYVLYTLIIAGGISIFMIPSSFFILKNGITFSLIPLLMIIILILLLVELYFFIRLSFSLYITIDKNKGARESIKESWNLTKNCFWVIFGKMLVIGLFGVSGIIAFGVGFLITYPLSMIILVMLYRDIEKFKNEKISFVVAEKIEEIKDKVEDIKEDIKEKVEDVKEEIKEEIEEIKEKVEEVI